MTLAYYRVGAGKEFWSEHWRGHSLAELLAVARRSPLTSLIVKALPRTGVVLEAGCGLGQYVALLREVGWRAIGVDRVADALAASRRAAGIPLAAMDLRRLAIGDGALAAYVSLGVVEHDAEGPDAILAEAARALAVGGVALVSVPYLNGVRRLGLPYLRWQNARIARRGADFHQYAFTRRELVEALARHGLVTRRTHAYDPARLLRDAWRRLTRGSGNGPGGAGDAAPSSRGLRGHVRRALYTPPALALLGHMILAVAVKR
ncbi:MAG: class I SAM-dependent methyltransferase [Candidatus Rokuibacteriota bacterium]